MGFFSLLSFLTPLYFAAGLAIAGPIVFHLIRRTPKGRQDFSSVMFLTPSPPRITRRSRIENWLLLALRVLAILLIVAAFMRPLWRQLQAGGDAGHGRVTVVLLDVSASMQREGLWAEAIEHVRALLAESTTADQVMLLTFDDRVTPVVKRRDWMELEPDQRKSFVETQLEELSPGWGGSNLDTALLLAADQLEQLDAGESSSRPRRVVVVSDLQAGCRWEGLQGFEWPSGIEVELFRVGTGAAPGNAGVQIVGLPQVDDPPFVRVRVSSAADGKQEIFQLGWRGAFDALDATGPTSGVVDVYVPPGQSRVVKLRQEGDEFSGARIVLAGDAHPFDNSCHVTWPERRRERIVYLGPDDSTDRAGLRFFLEPLFADTDERDVTILDSFLAAEAFDSDVSAERSGNPADDTVSLAIVGGEVTADEKPRLERWLREGGGVLYVCRDANNAAGLYDLAGLPAADVSEADVDGYAMLREVDFDHPLFRMLDDPRFSDVSKVRIWRHRVIPDSSLSGARVLARFDDGAIALAELAVGAGRLYVLTSGWDRGDSQLATWPKFIPIMNALLENSRPVVGSVSQGTVGRPLPTDAFATTDPAPREVALPDGTTLSWAEFSADPTPRRPGPYHIQTEGEVDSAPRVIASIAVNIPASESQTAPLAPEVLDSIGLRLKGDSVAADQDGTHEEQLARRELESRQKLWRWLLAAAVGVLLLETLLAARPGGPAETSAN